VENFKATAVVKRTLGRILGTWRDTERQRDIDLTDAK